MVFAESFFRRDLPATAGLFFQCQANRNGDVFLSIVESKPSEGESFDRRSIVIFGELMMDS